MFSKQIYSREASSWDALSVSRAPTYGPWAYWPQDNPQRWQALIRANLPWKVSWTSNGKDGKGWYIVFYYVSFHLHSPFFLLSLLQGFTHQNHRHGPYFLPGLFFRHWEFDRHEWHPECTHVYSITLCNYPNFDLHILQVCKPQPSLQTFIKASIRRLLGLLSMHSSVKKIPQKECGNRGKKKKTDIVKTPE